MKKKLREKRKKQSKYYGEKLKIKKLQNEKVKNSKKVTREIKYQKFSRGNEK